MSNLQRRRRDTVVYEKQSGFRFYRNSGYIYDLTREEYNTRAWDGIKLHQRIKYELVSNFPRS
jgi:hypothetical protein